MELHNNNKIFPGDHTLLIKQQGPVNDINDRISNRHFSDIPLEPNFAPRAVSTKYSLFPIINCRKEDQEHALKYPVYNVKNFNPSTKGAPSSGYFHNIDHETNLRNQQVYLQHNDSPNIYIPDSNSDLYKNYVVSTPSVQPHPNLFEQSTFSTSQESDIMNSSIGKNNLFNHTRTQLRNTN
tara:strand:- start:191 stop:733 length:543 start_codon:yes stop_codon:yes gene_type:complete